MAEFGYLLLVLVFAGTGSWIASYVREKGKNYATQEDVQKLTRLAEEVRAEVAGKAWLDQKRWDLRRDFYWQLLGLLSELSAAMQQYRAAIPAPAARQELNTEGLKQLVEEGKVQAAEFVKMTTRLTYLLGIGRILLPEHIVSVLDGFDESLRSMEKENRRTGEQVIGELKQENMVRMKPEELVKALDDVARRFYDLAVRSIDGYKGECDRVMQLVVQAARNDLITFEASSAR